MSHEDAAQSVQVTRVVTRTFMIRSDMLDQYTMRPVPVDRVPWGVTTDHEHRCRNLKAENGWDEVDVVPGAVEARLQELMKCPENPEVFFRR